MLIQRSTINGQRAAVAALLPRPPIEPGSVSATDELEVFADTDSGDGTGTLAGSAGGTGNIQYTTGDITLNFNSPPAPDQPITVSYVGQPGNAVATPPVPL